MAFTIGGCHKICNALAQAIISSFGPCGQLALIVDETSQATLTCSGVAILDAASNNLKSPIANVVNKIATSHHKAVGDGSKTLVLLLGSLFNSLCKELPDGSSYQSERAARMDLIRDVRQFENSVLQECFEKFRSSSACLAHKMDDTTDLVQLKAIVRSVVITFFTGKFGVRVSRLLVDLLCEFIFGAVTAIESFRGLLRYLIEHFETLCTRCGKMGLGQSHIIPGMLIHRDFKVYDNSLRTSNTVRFIIVYDNLDLSEDAAAHLRNASDVQKFIQSSEGLHANAIIQSWKRKQVELVFCRSNIPKSLESLCHLHKISVVVMIPPNELELLMSLGNIVALDNFHSFIEERNVGKLESVQPLVIGNERFVHLKITSEMAVHLILCGPTEQLCKQYFLECWNCLKLCFSCLSSKSDEGTDVLLICPAGGCWELEMAKIFKSTKQPSLLMPMLTKAFLYVLKILQANSPIALKNEIKMMSSLEPLFIDCEELILIPAKEALLFQPVPMKEKILSSLCQALLQILTVEGMISNR